MKCYFCRKGITIVERIGRQERCPHCGGDLHICKNCQHYDVTAYNECRETQAERVLEKESSNFCDYFLPFSSPSPLVGEGRGEGGDPAQEAKNKLKEMFKKKG